MSNSKVSINEMQKVVETGFGSTIGNVIDLQSVSGDFNDLGISLLTNSKTKSPRPVSPIPIRADNIEVSKKDPITANLEPIEFNTGDIPFIDLNSDTTTQSKSFQLPEINFKNESSSSFQLGGSSAVDTMGNQHNAQEKEPPARYISFEEQLKEKKDLLTRLNRLRNKGYNVTKIYTMDSSLEELKQEVDRLVDAKNLENSIKFQRQIMMGLITGLEMVNTRFNPLDFQLDGWSESVHENIDDFDEVFEELYDKYKGKGSMPPEARLGMMLVGSGFMFHVSNSFFKTKMGNVNLGDVLKANPQLARQVAVASASAAAPGFGNFIGAAMNGLHPNHPDPVNFNNVPAVNLNFPVVPPINSVHGKPHGNSQHDQNPERKEMKGPSGMEDILRTFEEVRNTNNMGSQLDEVLSQSHNSSDGIMIDEVSVSSTNNRGRKRKPVDGSTISLNV